MSSSGRQPWDANDPYPEEGLRQLQEAGVAPTDRPVEQFTEINPPPHETIPESADASPELASLQEAVRPTPPPLLTRDVPEEVANLLAASRNRCAFFTSLSAFNSQVNLMYQALGELSPEQDFADFPRTLGHLVLAVDLLQARLAQISALAKPSLEAVQQAAE